MKIKKKMTEVREKTKDWYERHKEDIRCFGWYLVGSAIMGTTCYILGHNKGVEDERQSFYDEWEDPTKILRIGNNDTGKNGALMSEQFYEEMMSSYGVEKGENSWHFCIPKDE